MRQRTGPVHVSVIIPIYNERDNIRPLHEALRRIVPEIEGSCEMIFVDDGSTDGSLGELHELAETDNRVRLVELRRNFGQTAAIGAGIQAASGDVVVTMDGDLQNDPADIPMMLRKLQEGYDLVHGWRKDRHDAFLTRKLPSRLANRLISRVTGFPVHDLGCTLKAMRTEVARELELYGEMHRFIPILADWRGARCAEVVTRHHPRRFGISKYGLSRTVRVLLDLITVKFLIRYLASPMRLFGVLGLGCAVASLLTGGAVILMKLLGGMNMTGNPLLLLTVLLVIVAVQFFGMGMLGELGLRIFYSVRGHPPYAVRRTVNFPASSGSAGSSESPGWRRAA